MRQYIDSNDIANTVRLLKNYKRGVQTVLVEKESQVNTISRMLEQRSHFVVPSLSRTILKGALELLMKDKWSFAFSSAPQPKFQSQINFGNMQWNTYPPNKKFDVLSQLDYKGEKVLFVYTKNAFSSEDFAKLADFKTPPFSKLEDDWNDKNTRRIYLIRKRKSGLSEEEQEELKNLKKELSKELNAAYPLPFKNLEKLEKYVNKSKKHLIKKK